VVVGDAVLLLHETWRIVVRPEDAVASVRVIVVSFFFGDEVVAGAGGVGKRRWRPARMVGGDRNRSGGGV